MDQATTNKVDSFGQKHCDNKQLSSSLARDGLSDENDYQESQLTSQSPSNDGYYNVSGSHFMRSNEMMPVHTGLPEGSTMVSRPVTRPSSSDPSACHDSSTSSPRIGLILSRETMVSTLENPQIEMKNAYPAHLQQHALSIGDAQSWQNLAAPPQTGTTLQSFSSEIDCGVLTGGDSPQPSPSQLPADQSPTQNTSRTHNANFPSALKILVSNNMAGSIIGRAGQTISDLQKQSSTRIKLSQTGDYYPGTQDRVCLVQGECEELKVAVRLLLERLHMLQEHQFSQHMAWQLQRQKGGVPSFDFVVRLLVPVSCCGMIIGKSGSNIKYLEESTGVSSVRLSPKDGGDSYVSHAAMPPTSERIVTVTGPSLESCLNCVCLILDGMVTHPDISRYSNMTTSYARGATETYSAGPRPMIASMPQASVRSINQEQPPWDAILSPGTLSHAVDVPRRIASSPDLPGVMQNQRVHGVVESQTPDRLGNYGVGIMPPQSPFSTLSIHGMHGASGSMHQLYLMPQVQRPMESRTHDGLPVPHSVSAPDLLTIQLDQSIQLSPSLQPAAALATRVSTSQDYPDTFAPHPPTLIAPGCFGAQILVPDSLIGTILGRGGATLAELESLSGTRIRASQRGEYVPGTRSRVVTIRGPTVQSVWQAQFLMSQRMILPQTTNFFSPRNDSIASQENVAVADNNSANNDTEAATEHPNSS